MPPLLLIQFAILVFSCVVLEILVAGPAVGEVWADALRVYHEGEGGAIGAMKMMFKLGFVTYGVLAAHVNLWNYFKVSRIVHMECSRSVLETDNKH